MSYVAFNTDLNLYSKKKSLVSTQCISTYFYLLVLGLILLRECGKEQILLFIIRMNPNFGNVNDVIDLSLKLIDLPLKFSKLISRAFSGTLPLYIFGVSITTAAYTLCLVKFQISCCSYVKRIPRWLPIILINLSNDVNLNPGPHFQNNLFNFMSWNVNSISQGQLSTCSSY